MTFQEYNKTTLALEERFSSEKNSLIERECILSVAFALMNSWHAKELGNTSTLIERSRPFGT